MPFTLTQRQVVPGPLDDVFDFFARPRNLEVITPAWLNFNIAWCSDEQVRQGTRIRYRLRMHGVPMRWESLITEFEPGVSFADTMIRGPYRSWHHRHVFRAVPGGVEIEDRVRYELPLGPLGRLAHPLVRRQLREIFAYRRGCIEEVMGLPAGNERPSPEADRSRSSSGAAGGQP